MSGVIKAAFAVVSLLLAVVLGAYLSGYLLCTWLGVDVHVVWNTWLRYYRALGQPAYMPYRFTILTCGGLGFGMPLLGCLSLWALALRTSSPAKTLHGDARFATKGDLQRAGMLTKTPGSIVIGRWGRSLIRLAGQQFVILAAPTRSGKGVGVVIPNLLEYEESMVVLDIKQENFDLTSGWRAGLGQDVYLFNPFAEDRRTHRWNPLSYVSCDPAFRISDIQAIAAMLYPDGADENKFWVSQARNAFSAFALYAFEKREQTAPAVYTPSTEGLPTLGHLFELSSGDGENLQMHLKAMGEEPFLGPKARAAFAALVGQSDDTFSSIMGTFREPLNAFLNPVLDAATSANDFLLTDVRKKKMTIYIGIQPNKLAESRVIINLFFSQLINENTRQLPQNHPELKYQCLMLMDEFTSIGRVDILAKSVSYMAGYNMRLLPIIQSMSQLDATYGRELARTLITNHALQIIYAPREQQDANDYSEMLGYTTMKRQNITRGRELSRSESEERRALMLPQELKQLGFEKEIFLYEGIPHPVKCQKIQYFKDKRFTEKLKGKCVVPPIEISVEGRRDEKRSVHAAVHIDDAAMRKLAA